MTRVFDHPWFSHASIAAIAVLLCLGTGSVEGSIILNGDALLDAEHFYVETDESPGAAPSSAPSPARDRGDQPFGGEDYPRNPDPQENALFTPTQSSTGGMSSGASGVSSSPIATGTFAINSTAGISRTANELSTRLGDDPSFTLPIPPDNELLRPPQVI